jgi:hypothetical protein
MLLDQMQTYLSPNQAVLPSPDGLLVWPGEYKDQRTSNMSSG